MALLGQRILGIWIEKGSELFQGSRDSLPDEILRDHKRIFDFCIAFVLNILQKEDLPTQGI